MKKNILLLLALVCTSINAGGQESQGIVINEENFPDPVFREYVSTVNQNGLDGILTPYEISMMTGITLNENTTHGKKVRSLKGVEFFTFTQYLRCDEHELESIDISALANLNELSCRGNQLKSLDVSKNKELTKLICANNQLKQLDVSHNNKLEWLDVSYNQLEPMDLSNCPKLHLLNVSHTGFTSVDYEFPELSDLNCSGNPISTINLSAFPQLSSVWITSTQIKKLEVSNLNSLYNLYVQDGCLEELDITDCPVLMNVQCNKNNLTTLSIRLKDVMWLDCSDNQLTELDLSGCELINELHCENNLLNKLRLPAKCYWIYCHDNYLADLDLPEGFNPSIMSCYGNYLKGDAVDALIQHLQEKNFQDGNTVYFYDNRDSQEKEKLPRWKAEGNKITYDQVCNAREKGWHFEAYTDNTATKNIDLWENYYTFFAQEQYAYRPFVEEGKTWTLCCLKDGADPSEKISERIEYQYLQGDTLIGGLRYKRWWIDRGENVPPLYAGAAREENLVVYFCPPGKTESQVIYDFSSPVGTIGWYNNFYSVLTVIYDVTLGENRIINTETYKGWCRDVSFNGTTVTWLQGVGYMGLVNLPFGGYILLSCAVGDEVLYYDASLMQSDAEAKKKKLDFTHVIKAQPRAPRHRARQEGDGTLEGEYSVSELFVRLNALMGDYTATLSDASGQVVYQKTVLTDNVLALSTALTAYGPGNYVLTLENDDEAYTATLNIGPNGIRPTHGPSRNGGELYDLQGRRLMKVPEKGLYIQDGKKKTHPQPLP